MSPVCSDHSVVCASLYNSVRKNRKYKRTIYNYNKLNVTQLNAPLQRTDWEDPLSKDDVDECIESFTELFMNTAKQCMHVKTVTIYPNDVPWMTDEIRKLINERKELHTKAKRTNLPEHWKEFRQFRNHVTSKQRELQQEYYSNLHEKICDASRFGEKEWWKLVKLFLNKKEINSEEIPSLEVNGKIIYSDKEKANTLNSFFIEQSTLTEDDNELPDIVPLDCELQEITISETEVNNVIKNLDPTKAVGPDLIHNKVLISSRNIIAPVFAKLFNKCLHKSKFPSTWKIAHVNPVYKTGAKESCSNYRPISLLSCVGKVFERCIHKHVYDFLKAHNIITPLQSGFIPGDSTVNQLLSTYHELCTSFEKGITTQVVYLDTSKAFDRV